MYLLFIQLYKYVLSGTVYLTLNKSIYRLLNNLTFFLTPETGFVSWNCNLFLELSSLLTALKWKITNPRAKSARLKNDLYSDTAWFTSLSLKWGRHARTVSLWNINLRSLYVSMCVTILRIRSFPHLNCITSPIWYLINDGYCKRHSLVFSNLDIWLKNFLLKFM